MSRVLCYIFGILPHLSYIFNIHAYLLEISPLDNNDLEQELYLIQVKKLSESFCFKCHFMHLRLSDQQSNSSKLPLLAKNYLQWNCLFLLYDNFPMEGNTEFSSQSSTSLAMLANNKPSDKQCWSVETYYSFPLDI